MSSDSVKTSRWRRWSVVATILGVLVLVAVFARVDPDHLRDVVVGADPVFLIVLVLALIAEQLFRALKWRQLLYDIRPVGVVRLFGTIMAGYFVAMMIPLGVSPIVRSWLVARLETLDTGAVLATAVIDRMVDGAIFAALVVLALMLAGFPDPGGGIRLGLLVGAVGSLIVIALIVAALVRYRNRAALGDGWLAWLLGRLPLRLSGPTGRFLRSFAEGIVWPREIWRGVAIVFASLAIKLVAIGHFLWAGLAFGVVLSPAGYVFLVAFLGFLLIITRFARVPGGFLVGAVFALELLGVASEPALAMTITVQLATAVTVATVGVVALWRHGVTLDSLRAVANRKTES